MVEIEALHEKVKSLVAGSVVEVLSSGNDGGRPQLEAVVKSLYSITPEFFVIDSKRPICVHSLHMCD